MQTGSVGPAYAGRVVTTWEEFAALPDDGYRYQIDDGRLVMTPAPLGPHQVVITNLVAVLKAACPAGFTAVPSPIDWVLSAQDPVRVRQPDIAVIGKEDRAVALLDPFPVVFRIEDLLLP